jgi:L-serine dehydratase
MSISVFDLFKIGIGPSSSHTVGPMSAAADFAGALLDQQLTSSTQRVLVELYGSLSATGKGHGTDNAVIMGLMGDRPATIDPDCVNGRVAALRTSQRLQLAPSQEIEFIWERDMLYLEENLPYHPNAMRLTAFDQAGAALYSNTY